MDSTDATGDVACFVLVLVAAAAAAEFTIDWRRWRLLSLFMMADGAGGDASELADEDEDEASELLRWLIMSRSCWCAADSIGDDDDGGGGVDGVVAAGEAEDGDEDCGDVLLLLLLLLASMFE